MIGRCWVTPSCRLPVRSSAGVPGSIATPPMGDLSARLNRQTLNKKKHEKKYNCLVTKWKDEWLYKLWTKKNVGSKWKEGKKLIAFSENGKKVLKKKVLKTWVKDDTWAIPLTVALGGHLLLTNIAQFYYLCDRVH